MKKYFLLIALILTFATHISFINSGFVWLDHNDIQQKQAVLPLNELFKAFIIPFGQTSFYRPAVTILNSLDNAIYGLWAPGFHLTNLILHLLVVIMAVKFWSIFFRFDRIQNFLGALLVGLHPASIMIVGEVIQRQESLLLLFLMLAIYLHADARNKKSLKNDILTTLFFSLALFTKETALVILPLLIAFWEFITRKPIKHSIRLFILQTTAFLAYVFLRYRAVPKLWSNQSTAIALSEAIATRISLFGKFSLDLFSPFKPGFSDSVKIVDFKNPLVILTLFFLLLLIYIIIKKGIKTDISKAIILLFILLLPGLNIVPVPRIGSPHYLYLPVVGVVAIALVIPSAVEGSLANARFYNRLFIVIISLWFAVASVVSFQSGFQFKNDLTLFEPEVIKDPLFLEGYYYLGKHYLDKGDLDRAQIEFAKGLRDSSGYLVFNNIEIVLVNLAAIKQQQGNFNEAEKLYDRALGSAPASLKQSILFNKALIANSRQDYQKIIELLSGIDWARPEPLLLLANAYHQQGAIDKEIRILEKALPLSHGPEKNNIKALLDSYLTPNK